MSGYDIVIINGTVVDPESCRTTVANIGISEGKIKAVARRELAGETVIDAAGKIVCPGFIDIHAHVEGNAACAEFMAAMGVTTVYNGNCGLSPDDFDAFFEKYEREGFLINQVEQAGHTMLRNSVGLTDRYRPADARQIADMEAKLEHAFQCGVWGLSFGLEYCPGSSKEEVLALSKIAAKYGKMVSIHTRTDMFAGLESLKEAIDITRLTGAAVNISHLVYQFGFGMAKQAVALIEDATRQGLDISVDSGVYCDFATAIGTAVFDDGCVEKWGCGYDSIVAATGKYRGMRLTKEQFLEMRRDTPTDTAIALVGHENEIYEILERPYVMMSTDAGTMYDNSLPGHPQDAGSYPRFFKKLVREQNRLSLPDAVRRCTYLPAKRLGLESKGRIKDGADADIVIFDLKTIEDKAQFPCYGSTSERPEGIDWVIVGGKVAVKGKELLPGANSGKVLRGHNALWEM